MAKGKNPNVNPNSGSQAGQNYNRTVDLINKEVGSLAVNLYEVSNKNVNVREARLKMEADAKQEQERIANIAKDNRLKGVMARAGSAIKRSMNSAGMYSDALKTVQEKNSEIGVETKERAKLVIDSDRSDLLSGERGEKLEVFQNKNQKEAVEVKDLREIVLDTVQFMNKKSLREKDRQKAFERAKEKLSDYKERMEKSDSADILKEVDLSSVEKMLEVLENQKHKISLQAVEEWFDAGRYNKVSLEAGLNTREANRVGEKVSKALTNVMGATAGGVAVYYGAKYSKQAIKSVLGPILGGALIGGYSGFQAGKRDTSEARVRAALGEEQKKEKHEKLAVKAKKSEELVGAIREGKRLYKLENGKVLDFDGQEVVGRDEQWMEQQNAELLNKRREAVLEARARWEAGKKSNMDFLSFSGMGEVEREKMELMREVLDYEKEQGVRGRSENNMNEAEKNYFEGVDKLMEGYSAEADQAKRSGRSYVAREMIKRGILFGVGLNAVKNVVRGVIEYEAVEGASVMDRLVKGGLVGGFNKQKEEFREMGSGLASMFGGSASLSREEVDYDGVTEGAGISKDEVNYDGATEGMGITRGEVDGDVMQNEVMNKISGLEEVGERTPELVKPIEIQEFMKSAENRFEVTGRSWEQLAGTSDWGIEDSSEGSVFKMMVTGARGLNVDNCKYLITIEGGGVLEYDIDENGFVKIPVNSAVGASIFEKMSDGNVLFKAKYGEVVQELGGGQVKVFNTDIGSNTVKEFFGPNANGVNVENMFNYHDGNLSSDLNDVGDVFLGNNEKVDIYNWTNGFNATENPYFVSAKVSPENFGGNLFESGMSETEAFGRVLKNVPRSPEQTALWMAITGAGKEINGDPIDTMEEINSFANVMSGADPDGANGILGELNSRINELMRGGSVKFVNLTEQGYARSTYIYNDMAKGDLVMMMAKNNGASNGMAVELFDKNGQNIFGGESLSRAKSIFKIPESESGRFVVRLDCGGQIVWIPDQPEVPEVPEVPNYVPNPVVPEPEEPTPVDVFNPIPKPEEPMPVVPIYPSEPEEPEVPKVPEVPEPRPLTPRPDPIPRPPEPVPTPTPEPVPTPTPDPVPTPQFTPKNPQDIIDNQTPATPPDGGGRIIPTPTEMLEQESPETPHPAPDYLDLGTENPGATGNLIDAEDNNFNFINEENPDHVVDLSGGQGGLTGGDKIPEKPITPNPSGGGGLNVVTEKTPEVKIESEEDLAKYWEENFETGGQ